MKNFRILTIGLILCALSFLVGRSCSENVIPNSTVGVINTTTVESTFSDTSPISRDSVVVKYRYISVPISKDLKDSTEARDPPVSIGITSEIIGDSARIEIPITQKKYETAEYRAYVSGYEPTLDSIFVTQRTTTIKIREPTSNKRFSIGLQAGYGMTPEGFQPYFGIGVSVNLWSF